MSNAWETTDEDVINVVREMGYVANEHAVKHILDNIDHTEIEKAALHGNDMDEQTRYAYDEIKRQIIERGL